MAGTQELLLVDPRDRASPTPIIDEALAKNVLANPLDHEALGLAAIASFKFWKNPNRKGIYPGFFATTTFCDIP